MNFEVVHGQPVLSIIESWKTTHTPGAIALLPDGQILWGPYRSRKPFIVCQKGIEVFWSQPLPNRPREISVAGSHIYVITGAHKSDEGHILVFNINGTRLASFTLAGFAARISIDPYSHRALIASGHRSLDNCFILVLDGPIALARKPALAYCTPLSE